MKKRLFLLFAVCICASLPLYPIKASTYHFTEDERPSQYFKANKIAVRLWDGLKIDQLLNSLDQCFDQACLGNAKAADHVSNFYNGVLCEDKETSIYTLTLAKKFAKVAAEGGHPDTYILLTIMDFGVGPDMEEHSRWIVRSFLDNPFVSGDPNKFLRMTNMLNPAFLKYDSLTLLRHFIARFSPQSADIRVAQANMYWKGFFGNCEKNKAKAFQIACQEWYLCQKRGLEALSTQSAAGSILYEVVKERSQIEKDEGLQHKALNTFYFPDAFDADGHKSMEPLAFIKKYTRLLEYYKITSEPFYSQLQARKGKTLRLDLHKKGKEESIEQVIELLRLMATESSLQSAIIITGKGNHSYKHKAILKPAIEQLLKNASMDKTFSIAYKEDSGEGAFKVRMINSSKSSFEAFSVYN